LGRELSFPATSERDALARIFFKLHRYRKFVVEEVTSSRKVRETRSPAGLYLKGKQLERSLLSLSLAASKAFIALSAAIGL
jgi:hypothetical protein